MDTVISTLIAGAAALFAAWLTHRWGEETFQEREAAARAERSAGVRLLITVEIDQNLAALASVQERVRTEEEQDRAVLIASMPPPPFRQHAWMAQMGDLARTFKQSELQSASHVYQAFDHLTSVRSELITIRQRDDIANANVPFTGSFMRPVRSWEIRGAKAQELANTWLTIADGLLAEANPLRE